MLITKKEIERFNLNCRPSADCIEWVGKKDKDGYGVFFFKRALRRAHRVSLYLAGIEIPTGFVVNHTCRKRDCVNPQHLQCVTVRENALKDSRSAGYINSQKTMCKKGHPFDKVYGKQRYCSICERAKQKRLKQKWKAEGIIKI